MAEWLELSGWADLVGDDAYPSLPANCGFLAVSAGGDAEGGNKKNKKRARTAQRRLDRLLLRPVRLSGAPAGGGRPGSPGPGEDAAADREPAPAPAGPPEPLAKKARKLKARPTPATGDDSTPSQDASTSGVAQVAAQLLQAARLNVRAAPAPGKRAKRPVEAAAALAAAEAAAALVPAARRKGAKKHFGGGEEEQQPASSAPASCGGGDGAEGPAAATAPQTPSLRQKRRRSAAGDAAAAGPETAVPSGAAVSTPVPTPGTKKKAGKAKAGAAASGGDAEPSGSSPAGTSAAADAEGDASPPQAQPPLSGRKARLAAKKQQQAEAPSPAEPPPPQPSHKQRRQSQPPQPAAVSPAPSPAASEAKRKAAASKAQTPVVLSRLPAVAAAAPPVAPSSLIGKMQARMQGAHFRMLNETLYTQSGGAALRLISGQPELFDQYHAGFRQQVLAWPRHPVDAAATWLAAKPQGLVVADLGCGDAKLAQVVRQKVHSFDLVAHAPGVVACNMAHVPLGDASVDVAVFSLALMGTDYGAFLVEATRLLRPAGWLWIAEVRSRFANAKAGGEDFRPFLKALQQLGFKLQKQDTADKMFVVFELRKAGAAGGGAADKGAAAKEPGKAGRVAAAAIAWPDLKPCLYKRR